MTNAECRAIMAQALVAEHALNIELLGIMQGLSSALGNDHIPEKIKTRIEAVVAVVLKSNRLFEAVMSIKSVGDEPFDLLSN